MSEDIYKHVLDFITEDGCYAVLEEEIGGGMFAEVLEALSDCPHIVTEGTDDDNGGVCFSACGMGCVLMYKEDCPFSIYSPIVKYVSRDDVIHQRDDAGYGDAKAKYKRFLSSEYWRVVREIKIKESGGRCAVCGSSDNLQVHHRSYEHHGNEHLHLDDLVVLCGRCHTLFHKGA